MKILILIAAVLLSVPPAIAERKMVYIQTGWITGQDFLEMMETDQRAYVSGLIDGILLAPFIQMLAALLFLPLPRLEGVTIAR